MRHIIQKIIRQIIQNFTTSTTPRRYDQRHPHPEDCPTFRVA